MGNLVFNVVYGTNPNLVISSEELKNRFLFGIPFCNPVTGVSLSDETFVSKILAAQGMIEKALSIKLIRQYIEERRDFIAKDYGDWNTLRTTYTIEAPMDLKGVLGEQTQITMPASWIGSQKNNAGYAWRTLYLVPNSSGGNDSATAYVTGLFFNAGIIAFGPRIPNYWNIGYITGFSTIPYDIINVIGKLATIQILPLIEQIVTGNGMIGIASQSLSMDGLSQSISKINGGNIFGARLNQYNAEIQQELALLSGYYRGIPFEVA